MISSAPMLNKTPHSLQVLTALAEASGLLNAPQVGESTEARPLNDLKRSAPRRGDQLIGIAHGQGTSYSNSLA